jgi:electron transport complex protein RnfG
MSLPDPAPESAPQAPSPTFGLPPAPRRALAAALGLLAFTVVFTALMAFTHEITRDRIQAAIEEQQMRLIDEVLPRDHYDNALLADVIPVNQAGIGRLWRARHGNAPVALVFEAYAPDGYGGRISLVISLDNDGRIGGVRVAAHKETPGLGDYIDTAKDRNKEKPWIAQFKGATAATTRWNVKKDGGDFDYHVGATVSARAVTRATGRAATWVEARRAALFAAPAGTPFGAEEK